ncbi:glycoside hydrolase [Schizopora paradoxa]|uniref:Glycoside hydrolase n=1 Tax=Schizopora paradoxa TaxID=27342 RepID=A0A0H2S9L9_9AGAM|nr:glycoside hydrolase [Schizopora paradoxa]
MHFLLLSNAFFLFLRPVLSQQIYDIFTTTWDRSSLFTYTNLSPNPINFVSPGATGAADIVVDDSSVFQSVFGFGASLTDSSAQLLNNLKNQNWANYWSLLGYLFVPTDGQEAAGLSYLRIPLGASDFSASTYSFDDVSGDTSFNNFNINDAPSPVFTVLTDILSVNSDLRIHILPWSPPGWMKSTNSMDGGTLDSQYVSIYANYLLKCVQGFNSKGFLPYAISIQNEPENSNPTYPSASMPVATEAQIGTALRTLLNNNGFSSVKIIGYEHNWNDAGGYPVQLMQQAENAFAGVSFHCYSGDYTEQATFHNQYPQKEIYFTECTGSLGSDWWSDIKWYMDNLFIGAITENAQAALMWNLALDGNGQPILPGSNSCGEGCRGVVQINNDGTWSVNQEFYSMAQASKAILPKDAGGPWGQRIAVSVSGSMSWGLVVGAYVTGRVSPTDWLRYSLVVLNWADNTNGVWNPQSIETTIEFRGMQATYTFPVGVTTLWWYAPTTTSADALNTVVHEAVRSGNTTSSSFRTLRFER